MEAHEQPTIDELLRDYGLNEILSPQDYADLLAQLQDRDNVMRFDAAEYGRQQMKTKFIHTLDKIISEV